MRTWALGLALVVLGVGCAQPADDVDDGAAAQSASEGPKLCAAVRGNGHYIITHFTSLARITETYGVVDAMAGGSSGSITTFLYESILENDATSRCGDAPCSPADRAARVALALKSLQGFGEAIGSSDAGVAVGKLVNVIIRLKQEMADRGVLGLMSTDTIRAAAALTEVLMIPEVRSIVNPEMLAMLRVTPTNLLKARYNVNEVYTSIATLGAFSVDDNRLFFRPGAINWDAMSTFAGRVGDFYAYGDLAPWYAQCATGSVGKAWGEIDASCTGKFTQLATSFIRSVEGSTTQPRRLGDRIGSSTKLQMIVPTSVLTGPAAAAYEAGKASWESGDIATGDIPFHVNFDDVKFGYWGSDANLASIQSDRGHFGDLKTKKMIPLGNPTWKEILSTSPAEPGLSQFVKMSDGQYSAGGWADLDPTLALRDIGCQHTILVTRQGTESEFAVKIAKKLGLSEDEWGDLWNLGSRQSSQSLSIGAADAVWCTNWNAFKDLEQLEMAADSWSSPIETRPGWSQVPVLNPYPQTSRSIGKPGCTPGVSGDAHYPQ